MGFSAIPKRLSATLFAGTISCLVGFSSMALAQSTIDPSSALLLNGGSSGNSRTRTAEPRLDSGRYTVRPRSQPATEKIPAEKTPTTRKQPVEQTPAVVASPAATPAPVESSTVLAPNEEGTVVLDEPASTDQTPGPRPMQGLSHRLIDLSIGTAYLYQASESSFSYRNSTIAAPAFAVQAKVWLSSQFAIGGRYLSTFGAHIEDTSSSTLSASINETAYGIYFKKPFSNSSLTFGIEYQDSNSGFAGETVSKVKTKSSGFRLGIEGEFQSSETSSWSIGFAASPKLNHEESAAATQVQSGADINAYSLESSIERRWKFDADNALYIRLEHKVERDLFTGPASAPDLITGATPNGVAVTVGKTLIQFGYNWGN